MGRSANGLQCLRGGLHLHCSIANHPIVSRICTIHSLPLLLQCEICVRYSCDTRTPLFLVCFTFLDPLLYLLNFVGAGR